MTILSMAEEVEEMNYPTVNGGVQKLEAQLEYAQVAYALYAQSVLANKISASLLSRKFI